MPRALRMLAVVLLAACAGPVEHVPCGSADDCDQDDLSVEEGDCDDGDASVTTRPWYADADGDGQGDDQSVVEACADAPAGYVANATDCNDADDAVYLGAPERCNGVDDDCDGPVDEDPAAPDAWYRDEDGDGHGDPATRRDACDATADEVALGDDCDDTDPTVHPDADDRGGDGVDGNCDGTGPGWEAGSIVDLGDAGRIDGEDAGDAAGSALAFLPAAGAGDGVVIGAPSANDGRGAVYLVGPALLGAGAVDLAGATAEIVGDEAGDALGAAVADAGDLDGDGYAELLVSAAGDDDGAADAGAGWLVFGPLEGISSIASDALRSAKLRGDAAGDAAGSALSATTGWPAGAAVVIGAPHAGADGGAVYVVAPSSTGTFELRDPASNTVITGSAGDELGSALDGRGDWDGDGVDDLLLGAPGSSAGEDVGLPAGAGAAYGLDGPIRAATFTVDALTAHNGVRFVGESADARFGHAVAWYHADGDGLHDVVVSAPADEGGAVYVFTEAGAATGVLTSSDACITIVGAAPSDGAGVSLGVLEAAADGEDGLLVGAPGAADTLPAQGVAYLLHRSFLRCGVYDLARDFSAAFHGETTGDDAGRAVEGQGDHDQDGVGDLLVGAPGAGAGLGAVHVLSGAND